MSTTTSKRWLVAGLGNRGQDQDVIKFRKQAQSAALPSRDSHVRSWGAFVGAEPPPKTFDLEWGRITMTVTVTPNEPSDIRFDFKPGLANRTQAFDFAKKVYDEFKQNLPQFHVQFVAAADHYHVFVSDAAAFQARAVSGLLGAISQGVASGRRFEGSTHASIASRLRHRFAAEE